MERPLIRIVTADATLRRVLTRILEASGRFTVSVHAAFPSPMRWHDLVITPVADCNIRLCEAAAARGARIVILAALPRKSDQEQYEQAGAAAYLPMDADARQFVASIAEVASEPSFALLSQAGGK